MLETSAVFFQKYMGTGFTVIFYLAAWLYLFIAEKEKVRRIMLLYVPGIILLVFFNPWFMSFYSKYSDEDTVFRFLWLIPFSVTIGYSVVKIVSGHPMAQRFVWTLLIAIAIALCGKPVYENRLYSEAENIYHVPQNVVDICDEIHVKGREVTAMFPTEYILYVRQYDPTICLPFGRESYTRGNPMSWVMDMDEIDVSKLAPLAKGANCNFVILSNEKVLIGNMEDYGYSLRKETGGYKIWFDTTIELIIPEI